MNRQKKNNHKISYFLQHFNINIAKYGVVFGFLDLFAKIYVHEGGTKNVFHLLVTRN